jgi:hypothetical protein
MMGDMTKSIRKWKSLNEIFLAMQAGQIRTFAEQSDAAARGVPATADESSARRAYLGHILSHDNPKRLP